MRVFAIIFVVLVLYSANGHAQNCKTADATSAAMISQLNEMMTGDSTIRVNLQLPVTNSSQIVFVSTDSVCLRARQALDSLTHATNPSSPSTIPARALYVISVGGYVAVADPTDGASGWLPMYIFDPLWSFLQSLIGWD